MSFNSHLSEIIGKRISHVVTSENQVSPLKQVFLVFEDGTEMEFSGENFGNSKGLYPYDLEGTLSYAKAFKGVINIYPENKHKKILEEPLNESQIANAPERRAEGESMGLGVKSSRGLEMIEKQKQIQDLFNHAAVALTEGKSKKSIISEFIGMGVPQDTAKEIVARANNFKKQEFRKGGLKTIGIGVGLFALGGVITAATYSAASSGGHYVVTTGLFFVGAWIVLKGLWRTLMG